MSAVEFSLATQTSFLHSLPQVHTLTGSEALAARYEGLSQLSRCIASMTLEEISRNLVSP